MEQRYKFQRKGRRIGYWLGVGIGFGVIVGSFVICALAPPVAPLMFAAQAVLISTILSTLFISVPACCVMSNEPHSQNRPPYWVFGLIPNILGLFGQAIGELIGEAVYDRKVQETKQTSVSTTAVVNQALEAGGPVVDVAIVSQEENPLLSAPAGDVPLQPSRVLEVEDGFNVKWV